MTFRNLVYIVSRNLYRMKIRVAMTAAGVLIGTASIVLVVSLGNGLQQANLQNMGAFGELTELTVYSPSSLGSLVGSQTLGQEDIVLNDKALQKFKKISGVTAVTPIITLFNSSLRYNRFIAYPNIVGIFPDELAELAFKMDSGAARLGQWKAIVGAGVAETFMDPKTRSAPRDPIKLNGKTLLLVTTKADIEGKPIVKQVRIRVVGILAKTGNEKDYTIYLSSQDVIDINSWANDRRPNYDINGYERAIIKVSDSQHAVKVEQAVMQDGFYVYSLQTFIRTNNVFFMIIQAILGSLGGIALFVAGFGIANAMIMSIYERTREIGLMKAVGAHNREVLFIFLSEAGSIGLIGGLGGVIIGLGLGGIINAIGKIIITNLATQQGSTDIPIPALVQTPFWLILFAITFSVAIGLASGLYPALRATQLDPIKALRYE